MHQINRKFTVISPMAIMLMGIMFFVLTLGAFEKVNHIGNSDGHAVYGYDTVAYFTEGKPVRGNEKYLYEWNDSTWIFASEEHLELFREDPEKYAPQYGGYCAWGLGAKNGLYSTDPEAWSIVDGKLYLNFNTGVRRIWNKDTKKYIKNANFSWESRLKKIREKSS